MYTKIGFLIILLILAIVSVSVVRVNIHSGLPPVLLSTKSNNITSEKSVKIDFNRLKLPPVKSLRKFEYLGNGISKMKIIDGKLWICDNNNTDVKIFDDFGKILKTIGKEGQAPWENERIVDFDKISENYYVADSKKMMLKKMDNKGNVLKYKKEKESFWGAIHLDNGTFLIADENPDDVSFYVSSINSNLTRRYTLRNIIGASKKISYINVAYEGYFTKNRLGNSFYVCMKAGLFLAFDKSGKFVYKATTIDKTPAPIVEGITKGDVTFFKRSSDVSINYATTSDEKYLYILSLKSFTKKAKNLFIDMYNVNDGKYYKSIEVPTLEDGQLPIDIVVSKNYLYVCYENQTIVKYEFFS